MTEQEEFEKKWVRLLWLESRIGNKELIINKPLMEVLMKQYVGAYYPDVNIDLHLIPRLVGEKKGVRVESLTGKDGIDYFCIYISRELTEKLMGKEE